MTEMIIAQAPLRVDPPHWYTGLKNHELQLIFHADGIQTSQVTLADNGLAKIKYISKLPNKNYLVVQLEITDRDTSGVIQFNLQAPGQRKNKIVPYSLLPRSTGKKAQGLTASDLIYLIFPDRFANGNPGNDVLSTLQETTVDRTGIKARHGGDLQGIMQRLNYVESLGTTAIWLNPILENDQPYESYHGYAATDLYKVDPRFGDNALFRTLVDSCHARNMKVIWDVVYNHWGNRHHMFLDMPDSSWFHWYPEFTRTSYRAEVLVDPYASMADKEVFSNAWFDRHMPDLNQQNPVLAKYLIQNSIWWIEYAGIDAFRIDTYAYPDQAFMKQLANRLHEEFPTLFLFGETWVQGSPIQSWFTHETQVKKNYDSDLDAVTDFQLFYAIQKGLQEPFGWEEGLRRIELTLSHDGLYQDPNRLVTFLDNHDLSRFYASINRDFALFKMGISLLYTLRGIPCIYYGTEILMDQTADPDAKVRADFPGGWTGDKQNYFVSSATDKKGRQGQMDEAFRFCSKLGSYRKNNAWLGEAKLRQFVPENNTYVYFRYDRDHRMMCIYNRNEGPHKLELKRFQEMLKGYGLAKDILSNQEMKLAEFIELEPKSVLLLELR
ncbi:MAG: alpha-amylase family glycosyl hydrolase [Flavobacteriales bacterium]